MERELEMLYKEYDRLFALYVFDEIEDDYEYDIQMNRVKHRIVEIRRELNI